MPAAAVDSVLPISHERNLALTSLLLFLIRAIRQSVLPELTSHLQFFTKLNVSANNYTSSSASLIKKKLQTTELFHSGTSIRSGV